MDLLVYALCKAFTKKWNSAIERITYDYYEGKMHFHTREGNDIPVVVNNGLKQKDRTTLDKVYYNQTNDEVVVERPSGDTQAVIEDYRALALDIDGLWSQYIT